MPYANKHVAAANKSRESILFPLPTRRGLFSSPLYPGSNELVSIPLDALTCVDVSTLASKATEKADAPPASTNPTEHEVKVGDKVMAMAPDGKGWTPGVVIQQWDEGNPYRIELEDGEGTNVWGPMDDDMFVKPR